MRVFKLFLVCIVFFQLSLGSSLWTDEAQSIFSKKSQYKVGDTITVVIDESLDAMQSGSTKTNKTTDVNFNMDNRADTSSSKGNTARKTAENARVNFGVGGRNSYAGTGKTSRETTIRTKITATVIDVQPNGSLFILGQRQLRVNDEIEQLEVSGIIKASQIADNNTVQSTQLANAKVIIKGSGAVSSPQKPSMLSGFFGWLF